MKITCFENLPWVNINTVEKVQIEGRHGLKHGHKIKINIKYGGFSKNFNWIEAWSSNHLIFILKTIVPYLFLFLFFYCFSQKISFRNFLIISKMKKQKF